MLNNANFIRKYKIFDEKNNIFWLLHINSEGCPKIGIYIGKIFEIPNVFKGMFYSVLEDGKNWLLRV